MSDPWRSASASKERLPSKGGTRDPVTNKYPRPKRRVALTSKSHLTGERERASAGGDRLIRHAFLGINLASAMSTLLDDVKIYLFRELACFLNNIDSRMYTIKLKDEQTIFQGDGRAELWVSAFENIITFVYTVILCWMSIGVISRNISASVPLGPFHPA
jgi:hypothetical protein